MYTTRFLNGVEIRPGAVFSHDPNVQLRFGIQVVCLAVSPDRWAGRLTFDGRTLADTDEQATFEQAAHAARVLLSDRIASFFTG